MHTSMSTGKLRAICNALFANALTLVILTLLLGTAEFYNGNQTVYTTKTGECYHLSGCSSLSYSKYKTTIKEAVQDGYRSCSNCDSPILAGEDGQLFNFAHYLCIVPFAALWAHIGCMEILHLSPKHPVLLYSIHLGISAVMSFVFDSLF